MLKQNEAFPSKKDGPSTRLLFATVFFLLLSLFAVFHAEQMQHMEITAHRGYSAKYPENTLAAFQGALDLGVDCIELDVQQTADGVLVVMHDQNLLRTTGLDKEVRDASYNEIRNLDDGSWFSARFSKEKIPTLEEVLALVKDSGVRLNVELKEGQGNHFEKDVIDLIRRYRMQNRCILSSRDYELLKEAKLYDPEMTTAFITSSGSVPLSDMKYADAFSIKADSVTDSVVRQVHAAGKKLFVWTVDTESGMKKIIDLSADDLITDNPALAIKEVSSDTAGRLMQAFASVFLPS